MIQEGLIERAFHDALFPALQYRAEAVWEEWEGNTGQEIFMSRAGLLQTVTEPLQPGVDPTPQVVPTEQWYATLKRHAGTIDIHMPTSAIAAADLFLRNTQQLGLQAGQSVNQIARNNLHQAYLSGHTCLTASAGAGDTTIQVASLNGFIEVVAPGVRPTPVTASNPLSITIGSGALAVTRNVIGQAPNDAADPLGPGVLTLSAAVGGAGFAARVAVLSSARPKIIRSGGGDTIDAISSSDIFVLQDSMNAVAALRSHNVPPHTDGTYHGHISAEQNAQVFADPVWQRLHTALPKGMAYQEGFLGTIGGISWFLNTESPNSLNCGLRTGTGTLAQYSKGIGAETVNESGVRIGRIIITGRGAMLEKGLDEAKYVSEAGVTGKLGNFNITNNGVAVAMERVRLYLRAPVDRLGDTVAATWSISTSFPVPSDVTALTGSERYKRAVIIETALA
jgi:hypothetical protein